MLCPHFLNNGICLDQSGCPHEHPNFFCDTCGRSFTSQAQYSAHFKSHQHRQAERAAFRTYATAPRMCLVCNVQLGGPSNIRQHEQGRAHRVRLQDLAQRGIQNAPEELYPVNDNAVFHCDICDSMEWNGREAHLRTVRHRNKEAYLSVRAALDEAEKDKYGICVSHGDKDGVDFGIVDTDIRYKTGLTITSTIPNTKYLLLSAKLSSSYSGNVRNRDSPFNIAYRGSEIMHGNAKEISLYFHSSDRGRFQDRLELSFYDSANTKRFAITRILLCIAGNREDYETIKPSAPYRPKHKRAREAIGTIEDGVKPPAIAAIKWEVELKLYNVPNELERVLKMDDRKARMKSVRDYMPREFTCETYARQFHTLLHVEEHKAAMDLQRYDEEAVTLEPSPMENLYYLNVPGLAERRPSVIVGDMVLVKNYGSTSKHWFSGYVHKVKLLSVGLKFSPRFDSYRGQKYDIRFCLGRLPLRRMHQALDSPFSPPRLLFPFEAHIIRKRKPSESDIRILNPINRLLKDNEMQRLAVTAIRNLEPGSPPFIVFGPPGTGKTVTIIESIRQILLKDPEARILACAPSNSATDLIAERLEVLGPLHLFRMNAPSRAQSTLPSVLGQFSRKNDYGTFLIPTKAELMKFRVVVSTCISACVPYNIGVPRGHFTHIFVDEAGQAAEPEAMIPIKTMSDGRTNIILSGDPKQLGPIVRSDLALTLKLGVSYLDRLCETQTYDESQMNGITVVKLLKNFRSHRHILFYPNEKFYKGELQTCADPVITQSCIRWSELPMRGVPMIFHAMQGKDEREASSPSFFNVTEASEVKNYVKMLKEESSLALKDQDIGVIAPYHAQVGKIRTLLRKVGAEGVKVGSVEEFQGQERRVMIISTVRSSMDYVLSDIRHCLGFVANPRRFNVAITRAKALLIVIGDPRVLSLDPLWRGFLNYMYNLRAWKGKPIPDWDTALAVEDTSYDVQIRRQAQVDDAGLIARIADAVEGEHRVDDLENEGHQVDAVVVERPWREAE